MISMDGWMDGWIVPTNATFRFPSWEGIETTMRDCLGNFRMSQNHEALTVNCIICSSLLTVKTHGFDYKYNYCIS